MTIKTRHIIHCKENLYFFFPDCYAVRLAISQNQLKGKVINEETQEPVSRGVGLFK